jgi:hypothetical protein
LLPTFLDFGVLLTSGVNPIVTALLDDLILLIDEVEIDLNLLG